MLVSGPGADGRDHAVARDWLAYVAVIVSAAVTLSTLAVSMRRGRLASVPTVDNVIYMASGARWLRAFEERGLSGVVQSYLALPSHAPYSSTLAFMAFQLFGVHDWGPPLLSGIIPTLGLLWCVKLTRGIAALPRVAVSTVVACLPLWQWSIEIFKPDYFAALVTAISLCLLLTRRRLFTGAKPAFVIGAIVGVALWAKPSVFPGTLFYVAMAFAARSLREWGRWDWPHVRRLSWSAAALATGALVVAGPHFAFGGSKTIKYINNNMFGANARLWSYDGTLSEQLCFYLTGPAGSRMLGASLWILLGGCVAFFVCNRRLYGRAGIAEACSWGVVLCAAFGLPAFNRMKTMEFAACFYFLLMCVYCLGAVRAWRLQQLRRRRIPVASAVLVACAVLSLSRVQWTIPLETTELGRSAQPTLHQQAAAAEEVFSAVKRAAGLNTVHVVVMGAPGVVNHNLFTLWTVRDRLSIQTSLVQKDLPMDELRVRMGDAQVLIANDGHTCMTEDRRAPTGLNERLLGIVSSDASWKLFETVPVAGTSGRFCIFVRQEERPK